MSEFDQYAEDYDNSLNEGLSVSGENRDYFAAGRIKFLQRCLDRLDFHVSKVMDYGCGTGSATPFLMQMKSVSQLVGIDLSEKSLEVARRRQADFGSSVQFRLPDEYVPDASADLVFCNGVFHHIPLDQQADALRYVANCLRPGGYFAFWENNPWNPGTRYIMSRIPFDRDAIMIWPRRARRLLRDAGLPVVRTDCCFIYPKLLGFLRPTEKWFTKIPLGAQYQVLTRKPL
jgi:SAM-dependent methyltransferase